MIIKRKLFTKYDDTDNLKRMKDSDILAEKPKQAPGYGSVAGKNWISCWWSSSRWNGSSK